MNRMINYLCTSPEPSFKNTDALYNEIYLLQNNFSGNVTSLNPVSTKQASQFPILLYGVFNTKKILKLDKKCDINHIYAASIFHIPIVYLLKKPVIYSVFAGINENAKLPQSFFLKRILKFVVSNDRDFYILKEKGIKNVEKIIPTINTKKFPKNQLNLDGKLHLLMASAPWDFNQFQKKGIHLLLAALHNLENVHITFLWRNVHPEYMQALIKQFNVEDKTTFINEFTDVSKLNKKIHGTVLLSNDCTIIKAYPSSIVESIVSGKPVIVSKNLPISNYIYKNNCGLVLNNFNVDSLIDTLKNFRLNYNLLRTNTLDLNVQEFSHKNFLDKYQNLYNSLF